MLHEKYLPEYQFSEKHQIVIAASPEKIYPLIDEMDFSGSFVIRTLFRLRGMKAGMAMKKGLLNGNFMELEQIKNEEMILGLVGQFWKLNGNLKKIDSEKFRSFQAPGFLKSTWNFKITSATPGTTTIETETRVQALDNHARKIFSRYWFFIKPFSGLIRMEMLRSIKRKAEQK